MLAYPSTYLLTKGSTRYAPVSKLTSKHQRLGYSKELHTPHLLTREELADHLVKYVAEFNLNLLNSAAIQTTTYDTVTKRWTVEIHTPSGRKTIVAKQLIQATGIGAQKPYLPSIADADKYRGISVHSVDYRNAEELAKRGAKASLLLSGVAPFRRVSPTSNAKPHNSQRS